MTLRTLESLTFWFGAAAIVLSVLAALASGLTWYFRNSRDTARDAASSLYKAESDARIAEASAAAGIADARAAEANLKAAEATALAESFRLDIAQANKGAAEANAAAERERLERLKIQASLAPRVIPVAEGQAMSQTLKSFGPQSVQVVALSNVTEVAHFTQSVVHALQGAGWTVAHAVVLGGSRIIVQGTVVLVRSDATGQAREAATSLVTELKRIGVGASFNPKPVDTMTRPGAMSGSIADQSPIHVMIGNKQAVY